MKRYECHTVLSLDEQSPDENLRVILDAMAGDFPFTGGKYYCYAGAFRAATVTLTDDDIAGDETVTFAPMVGADQTPPNVMTGRIYSAAHNWLETGVPVVANSTYITADGQEEPLELDLVATTDLRQANYLMGVRLEQMRPGLAGTLTVMGRGADLMLMDAVQISAQGYEALAGKTFEIRKRTNHWNGRYTLDLREVRSSTYALDADRFTAPTTVTPPDASELWNVTPVAITTVSNAAVTAGDGSVVCRALVTWTAHAQRAVNPMGRIEVRYRMPGEEWTYATPVDGDATKTYISPLRQGSVLIIEARARNIVGAVSEWTGTDPFTVTGNNDVPPDVTGLTHEIKPGLVRLQWDRWESGAYLETELRVDGTGWDDATFLWAGPGSEYHHPRPANGTYTVRAKHRSRAGVASVTAATRSVTVDDSIDPGAPDSLYVEYSVDGSTGWHSTFTAGDLFARWKTGVGGTWTGPFRIVGETGSSGDYVDFIFRRSATQPTTPTGDTPALWFDAPPAADGNPLWASTGNKTAAGVLIGAWSTPVQIEGAAGSDAQTLMLTATGFAFVFPTATSTDASAPNQIDFTANLQNVTGTVTFTATAYDSSNSALGSRTLTSVTATTCRLTKSNFTTGAGFGTNVRYVRVTATLGSLSDTITIYRGDDGASAVQAILSNEAHVVPTASDGSGGVFTGSGTTIRVFEGVTELTYDGVGSGDGTWRVSRVNSGVSGPAVTDSGVYATNPDITSMSADLGSFTFTINGKSLKGELFELVKVQSFAKSKTGATGATGAPGGAGATGSSGASSRVAYALFTISSYTAVTWDVGTTRTVSGDALPGAATVSSPNAATAWTATTQAPAAGQAMYQCDGTYDAVANQTVWTEPYLSNFRVGSLSAISADLGTITAGTVTGATVRTAASGARVELSGNSLKAINAGGSNLIEFDNAGSAKFRGGTSESFIGGGGIVTGLSAAAGTATNSATTVGGYFWAQGTLERYGLIAETSSPNGAGLWGNASATGADGVKATHDSTGNALRVTGKSSFSGQITSTLATGTAPFSVASTTLVSNLNVGQLLGKTWASPDPIGATTPNTGRFTTLRVDQTPNATNGGGALTNTNTPTGHAGGALRWVSMNFNGVAYLVPCIPA